MKKKVVAIGLDAADPVLLERWMQEGHLPNLSRICAEGAYGRLRTQLDLCGTSVDTICSERNWVIFSTGCFPQKTGYWDTAKYHPENYEVTQDRNSEGVSLGYDYQEFKAFYDLGEDYQVCLFDVPMSGVSDSFNGVEIAVWGGHSGSHMDPRSKPETLLPEIHKKYGRNPLFKRDFGVWWDKGYLEWIQNAIAKSASTRAKICKDLMAERPWDLFITVFGEAHSAGHDLLHFSEKDHPLHPHADNPASGPDRMLEAFQNIDAAVGEIVADLPEDTYVVVFGVHGITNNMADLANMAFLPELVYRYNYGKPGLAPGKPGKNPPPQFANPKRKTWPGEVWQERSSTNPVKRLFQRWTPSKFDKVLDSGANPALKSPYELLNEGEGLAWMPNMWYQNLWPEMKAFALPGVAEGFVRINLKGRDRDGVVEPGEEYETICKELTDILYRLTDARTGKPIVKSIARTRPEGDYGDEKRPDADLVITWHGTPTDVVDSPDLGRIGPLTYYRPGGHTSRGFMAAKGPGISQDSNFSEGQATDLAPTILGMMGAEVPEHLDGNPLVNYSEPVAN